MTKSKAFLKKQLSNTHGSESATHHH
jgi:hypothetical protein